MRVLRRAHARCFPRSLRGAVRRARDSAAVAAAFVLLTFCVPVIGAASGMCAGTVADMCTGIVVTTLLLVVAMTLLAAVNAHRALVVARRGGTNVRTLAWTSKAS